MKQVKMPKKSFVKEHEKLIDILKSGSRKKQVLEAAKQKKELNKHK